MTAPPFAEGKQVLFGLLQRYRSIDLLQVHYDLLDVLIADVAGRGSNLVYNATLQTAVRKGCFYGLHHSAQAVRAKQIHVYNSTTFELIQHVQPKFAALMLSDPDPKNVFSTIHRNAENDVGCLCDIAMILFHLVVNGIHEYERINAFQRAILPGRNLRHNLLADFCHQLRRYFYVVEFLNLLCDISLTHATGIQRENFFLHSLCVPVIFSDYLRLIVSLPVTGYFDFNLAKLRFDGLF